jgi:hypothetical protein
LSTFVSQIGSLILILKVKFNKGFKEIIKSALALKEPVSKPLIQPNKVNRANRVKRSKALPLPAKLT